MIRLVLQALAVLLVLSSSSYGQSVAFNTPLEGGQQVPPNATVAYGTSTFVLDRAANTLTYAITATRLNGTETEAHVHGFAAPGAAAPVLFDLPLGKTKVGTWSYPEAIELLLLSGQAYVDVHTTGFPAGQIRGQLVRSAADATLGASIDRKQVVGFSSSPATGTGAFTIDTVKNRLFIEITIIGLVGNELSGHIHQGAAGQGGGILFTLPAGMHKLATWKYDEVDEAKILSGGTYVNIHTTSFPKGEVRGQVLPLSTNPAAYCVAKINSGNCQPVMGWSGQPTSTGADDFTLSCTLLVNNQNGLFFWGLTSASTPFGGGTLCVQAPIQRTAIGNTGGSPGPSSSCTGSLSYVFSQSYMAAQGLGPGALVYGQWWALDSGTTMGARVQISDAVQFEIRP